MTPHSVTMDTPDGAFTVLLDEGNVLASGWTDDVDSLLALVHPSLRPERDALVPRTSDADDDVVGPVVKAVTAYYEGDHEAPGKVPVRQHSGEFRMHSWDVLREVPAGDPITYTEYAKRADRPTAVRAAAAACSMNAAALFVPCHRVLRTDGSLGGFRYGLEIKQRLLDREAPAECRTR